MMNLTCMFRRWASLPGDSELARTTNYNTVINNLDFMVQGADPHQDSMDGFAELWEGCQETPKQCMTLYRT